MLEELNESIIKISSAQEALEVFPAREGSATMLDALPIPSPTSFGLTARL